MPDIIDANGGASKFSSVNAVYDITDMFRAANMEEQYFPAYLDGGRNAEGRLVGLPLFAGAEGLFYRTDYFEQAGLDPKKPPKTWVELVDAAKKLTDRSKGRSGFGIYSKSQTQRMFNFMKPAGPDGSAWC